MPQQHFDIAVVGAGIIGSAIAYECAARGARVLLLDRGEPGAQASGAAAGMLAPCSEAHQPGAFLDLARHSLSLWPEFAARIQADSGIDPELSLDGLLRVALDDAAEAEVHERLAWQAKAGIDEGRWVDAAAARELEPAVSEDIRGAAWYPGEGHVHSRRAVAGFVAAARHHGASVQAGARLTGGAEIPAEAVVLAGGAWLGDLAAAFSVGGAPPLRPVFGQLAVLHGVSQPPRRIVYAGRHGYVVAKRDGTVLAGATAVERGFDTAPDAGTTAMLRSQAARLVPTTANTTRVEARTGLRPCTPDELPLLGPLSNHVLVAGGHYRNGVLLAPATAAGMASLLLDARTPPGWEAFDPRRFG